MNTHAGFLGSGGSELGVKTLFQSLPTLRGSLGRLTFLPTWYSVQRVLQVIMTGQWCLLNPRTNRATKPLIVDFCKNETLMHLLQDNQTLSPHRQIHHIPCKRTMVMNSAFSGSTSGTKILHPAGAQHAWKGGCLMMSWNGPGTVGFESRQATS